MNRPDDDLHDPLLSRLYRELPEEQPGAATDAAIRAAARQAVGAGPGSGRRRLSATSRITATAAALLLGVALTVQWQREDPERLREALATSPRQGAPLAREVLEKATEPAARPPAKPAPASPPVPAMEAAAAAPAAHDSPPAPASIAGTDVIADELARSGANARVSSSISGGGGSSEIVAEFEGAESRVDTLASSDTPASPSKRKLDAAQADSAAAAKATEALAAARREEARHSADALVANRERALAAQPRSPLPALAPAPAAGAAAAESASALAQAESEISRPRADRQAAADYRPAMAEGRLADALALLPGAASRTVALDRDLLQAASGHRGPPACARLVPPLAGGEALLCEYLRQHAGGKAVPPDWRSRLEGSGALTGKYNYRRMTVEKLWGFAARP